MRAIPWFSRTVHAPGNLKALRRAVAARPGGVMLESISVGAEWGRYSIFAMEPLQAICVHEAGGVDPFAQLARACRGQASAAAMPGRGLGSPSAATRGWRRFERPPPWPFVGGWIGYLAYEAGRFVEPRGGWDGRESAVPVSCWGLYDTVLICDHARGEWAVAGLDEGGLTGEVRVAVYEELIANAESAGRHEGTKAPAAAGRLRHEGRREQGTHFAALHGQAGNREQDERQYEERAAGWSDTQAEYLRKVGRVIEYIRAGDVFQVNLARRFRTTFDEAPVELYERLCECNPASYAAYIGIETSRRQNVETSKRRGAVVSSAPELFLSLRGREAVTRPIKGTRARGGDAGEDAARRAELEGSAKDRAELAMIVDLERNDLGRVCEYGSVRVVNEGEIETLPTVFHRTATVTGRLREECDAIDLLRATFPGGSITGAPKVRAMQIINELEDFARGPYCGAIGWIGVNGDMMLNLAIRTMTVSDGAVDMCVGSGIVADSDPEQELSELEAKAGGMMKALAMRNAVRHSGSARGGHWECGMKAAGRIHV